MLKDIFPNILPAIPFLIAIACQNPAMADNASDYVLTVDKIPRDWEISYTNETAYPDTYAEEKVCGIASQYRQGIITDRKKQEVVALSISAYQTKDGAVSYFAEHMLGWCKKMIPSYNVAYIKDINIADESFCFYENHDDFKFKYLFRKNNVLFSVASEKEPIVKRVSLLLLGYKEPMSTLPKGAQAAAAAVGAAAAIAIATAIAKALAAASAAKAASAASHIPKSIHIKPAPQIPISGPRITISKPPEPGPRIKFAESEQAPEAKEKKKKPQLSQIILKAMPNEVVADGKSKSQIQIFTLDDSKQPIAGERIELWFESYDGSKIEPNLVTTNVAGQAQAVFTASNIKGEQKLSARAQSNWEIKTDCRIKLKEEVYYEVRETEKGFKLRVNIPSKVLSRITEAQVLGARALDYLEKEAKFGYPTGLIALAAIIGYYGINSDAPYKAKAETWKKVQAQTNKIVGDLESALAVGFGVGLMNFANYAALQIAEAVGGKPIEFAAKVIGKLSDKLGDFGKIGLEAQERVHSIIKEEKDYYKQMSFIANELALYWSRISHTSGDPDTASMLISLERETEFYELNNMVLQAAQEKATLTGSFSESEHAALGKGIESLNRMINETMAEAVKLSSLREKIRGILFK